MGPLALCNLDSRDACCERGIHGAYYWGRTYIEATLEIGLSRVALLIPFGLNVRVSRNVLFVISEKGRAFSVARTPVSWHTT